MYTDYWGLKKPPFDNVPDPSMYVDSHVSVENTVAETLFAIEEGNECLTVIVGDVGLGKTLSLRLILDSLDQSKYKIAFVTNPDMSFVQILREIIGQLTGKECEIRGRTELLEVFNKLLFETADEGRKVLVFIDEANAISPTNLESLRLLTNMQDDTRNLFTIVLAGQMELAKRLEHPKRANLFQRIGTYNRIEKMDNEELLRNYIDTRLKIAGADRGIFTDDAIHKLYQYSEGGVPRLVNKIAKLCLKAGETNNFSTINGDIVQQIGQRFLKMTGPAVQKRTLSDKPKKATAAEPVSDKAESKKKAAAEVKRTVAPPPPPPIQEKPVFVPPPPPPVEEKQVFAPPAEEKPAFVSPSPTLSAEEEQPITVPEPVVSVASSDTQATGPETSAIEETVSEDMEEAKPLEEEFKEELEFKEISEPVSEVEPEREPLRLVEPEAPEAKVEEAVISEKEPEQIVAAEPVAEAIFEPVETDKDTMKVVSPEPEKEEPVFAVSEPSPAEEKPVFAAPEPPPPVEEEPVFAAPEPPPPVEEKPVFVAPEPPPVEQKPVFVPEPAVSRTPPPSEEKPIFTAPSPPPPMAEPARFNVEAPAEVIPEVEPDVAFIAGCKIKIEIPPHIAEQTLGSGLDQKRKIAGVLAAQTLEKNPQLTASPTVDPVSVWSEILAEIMKRLEA